MTIEYAVKVDKTNAWFDEPEPIEYLRIDTDPAVPYRKMQGIPAAYATLVQRRDGGDWEPVNGIDTYCIAMHAQHDIIKTPFMSTGAGKARCICGWKDDESFQTGLPSPRYEAAAEQHLASVAAAAQRFRDQMRYVQRTPEQESCPHKHAQTSEHVRNTGVRDWRCRDCGLHMQYIADFETWMSQPQDQPLTKESMQRIAQEMYDSYLPDRGQP